MGKKPVKNAKKGSAAGLAFTAAMIACCGALYLLGRGGAEEAAVEVSPAPAPAAEAERAYPAEEVFFQRAEGFGLTGEVDPAEGYAPSLGYTIARGEELGPAELVLSMKNGGVCAFTLATPVALHPGPPPEDPTPVELSLYEQRLARHELEGAWREAAFNALVSAMDIMSDLTYGDRTEMYALIQRAELEGGAEGMEAEGFELSALVLERDGADVLSASVSIAD